MFELSDLLKKFFYVVRSALFLTAYEWLSGLEPAMETVLESGVDWCDDA